MLQANNLISDRIPDELFVGGTTVVVFFEYLTHLNDPLGSLIVYSASLADKGGRDPLCHRIGPSFIVTTNSGLPEWASPRPPVFIPDGEQTFRHVFPTCDSPGEREA